MSYTPIPRPSFADNLEYLGVFGGRRRYRDDRGRRFYEYDGRHAELEIYNAQGHHLGVADVMTGELIKGAIRGRKIKVV